MTVEDYKRHGFKFMQDHGATDYFITGLILWNFYDFDNPTHGENEKRDDLLKWFLADLRFPRKVELFREILKRDYLELFKTYNKTFATEKLLRLNSHRNLLAHSFIMKNDTQELEAIKLTSFSGKNTKDSFKVNLTLHKAAEHENELAKVLLGLEQVYNKIGINTGRTINN
jgi:hypothetical protein